MDRKNVNSFVLLLGPSPSRLHTWASGWWWDVCVRVCSFSISDIAPVVGRRWWRSCNSWSEDIGMHCTVWSKFIFTYFAFRILSGCAHNMRCRVLLSILRRNSIRTTTYAREKFCYPWRLVCNEIFSCSTNLNGRTFQINEKCSLCMETNILKNNSSILTPFPIT